MVKTHLHNVYLRFVAMWLDIKHQYCISL